MKNTGLVAVALTILGGAAAAISEIEDPLTKVGVMVCTGVIVLVAGYFMDQKGKVQ